MFTYKSTMLFGMGSIVHAEVEYIYLLTWYISAVSHSMTFVIFKQDNSWNIQQFRKIPEVYIVYVAANYKSHCESPISGM